MRRCRLVALAAAGGALACAPAVQAAAVRGEPRLQPRFHTSTPDYTVRCRSSGLRLHVDPPAGTRVAVGGGTAHRHAFELKLPLRPGQGTTLRFMAPGHSRTYGVRCLPSDFPKWTVRLHGRRQARWYLLTPNDFRYDPRYVTVVDSHGVPVWWMRRHPAPFDVHLLPDRTLAWAPFAANTSGAGPFEVWSLSGERVGTYSASGSITNQHDLNVQPDGSAYLITYRPRSHVDLSRWGGPSDAIVLDGEVQQVDRDGNVLWRWNTKDHVRIAEAGRWLKQIISRQTPIRLRDGRPAYDIVHMNSVEPFAHRLVFSARYLDAVYEIDRDTGKVIWKLGGRHTRQSLKIEGDPLAARDFGGNHDARVHDGGKLVTLFDNGSNRNRPPRALEFRIHAAEHTARLVREITYAPAADSVCCGSARLLPGGDWVVGWGHAPWVTEQRPDGKPVFELRFHDPQFSSYRALPVLPGELSRAALRRGMDAIYGGQ